MTKGGYGITRKFANEVKRIRDKVDGIAGPGISNGPQSLSVGPTQSTANSQSRAASGTFARFKIVAEFSDYITANPYATETTVSTEVVAIAKTKSLRSATSTHEALSDVTAVYAIAGGINLDDSGGVAIVWHEVDYEPAIASPIDQSYTGEHTEAAASDVAWATGDGALKVTAITGVSYYDAGDQTLYAYAKDLTFDSSGRLIAQTVERRVSVDVVEACP